VGNGIQIKGVGFTAQSQRFKRYGPAAGKHVQHFGPWGTALLYILKCHFFTGFPGQSFSMRLKDMALGFLNYLRVARIFAKPFQEFCGICATKTVSFFRGPVFRPELIFRHKGSINSRSAGNQWPPRPPEMKG